MSEPAYEQEQEEEVEQTLVDVIKADPSLLLLISDKAGEMIELEKQSKLINEKKSLIREQVVERGVNRHSFAAAIARKRLTETDREERELSYQVCCHALGVEHQMDLLGDLKKPNIQAVE